MGNTAAQLLAEMEFGGSGGGGMGAGNGYGASRGGPNVGLYGSLPGMIAGGNVGSGHTESSGPGISGADAGGANPDQATLTSLPGTADAGAVGEASIPVQYRRRVGQYFQRVVDENRSK